MCFVYRCEQKTKHFHGSSISCTISINAFGMFATNRAILSNWEREWVVLWHLESLFGEGDGMIAKPGLLTVCEVRESTISKNTRSEKPGKSYMLNVKRHRGMSLLEIASRLWGGCGSRRSSWAERKKLSVLSRHMLVPVKWRLFFCLFWYWGANSRMDITNTTFIVEKENGKTLTLVWMRSSSYKLVCHYVSLPCVMSDSPADKGLNMECPLTKPLYYLSTI